MKILGAEKWLSPSMQLRIILAVSFLAGGANGALNFRGTVGDAQRQDIEERTIR